MLVPTMIYALLDSPRLHDHDLSSLEIIYYGASAMSPARLAEAIDVFGPVFFQFSGQAEAPQTLTVMRRDEHERDDPARLASCGRPVRWVDLAPLHDEIGRASCRESACEYVWTRVDAATGKKKKNSDKNR